MTNRIMNTPENNCHGEIPLERRSRQAAAGSHRLNTYERQLCSSPLPPVPPLVAQQCYYDVHITIRSEDMSIYFLFSYTPLLELFMYSHTEICHDIFLRYLLQHGGPIRFFHAFMLLYADICLYCYSILRCRFRHFILRIDIVYDRYHACHTLLLMSVSLFTPVPFFFRLLLHFPPLDEEVTYYILRPWQKHQPPCKVGGLPGGSNVVGCGVCVWWGWCGCAWQRNCTGSGIKNVRVR